MFSALQGGEKGYLKLFDAIEKHGDYNEKKIRTMFAGDEFLKRLPAVKNYLYSQILRSLRVFHASSTSNAQVSEMIEDISILYEKRLYKQCYKILEKAKEFATKNELFLQLINLNEWEEKVLLEILDLDKFEQKLESALKDEASFFKKQTNSAEYRNLYNRIVVFKILLLATPPFRISEPSVYKHQCGWLCIRNLVMYI